MTSIVALAPRHMLYSGSGMSIGSRASIWTIAILLCGHAPAINTSHADDCSSQSENFPLTDNDLPVTHSNGAILFTAGMTIDADGAPNAYAPLNTNYWLFIFSARKLSTSAPHTSIPAEQNFQCPS